MNDMEEIPEADRLENAPHPREALHLIGHEKAERAFLDSYISGHLHHAWLITGPKGVGKATFAWRIAKFLAQTPQPGGLFSEQPQSLDISQDSPIFQRVRHLSEPSIYLVRRQFDRETGRFKKAITVDDIRHMHSHFALTSTEQNWRIALIDCADELNTNAANALLKLLEEPPSRSIFLLISHQPFRLLPTIRSRCRKLALNALSHDEVHLILQQISDAPPPDPIGIELAGGSVGDALAFTSAEAISAYKELTTMIRTHGGIDRQKVVALSGKMSGAAHIDYARLIFRLLDILLARLAKAALTPITPVTEPEAALFNALAHNQYQARQWAGLIQSLSSHITHALAVNIDAGQVFIDTMLKLEATAHHLNETKI